MNIKVSVAGQSGEENSVVLVAKLLLVCRKNKKKESISFSLIAGGNDISIHSSSSTTCGETRRLLFIVGN